MGGFFGGGGGGRSGGGFAFNAARRVTTLVRDQNPVSSAPVSQAAAQIKNAVGQVIDTSAPTVNPKIVGTTGPTGAIGTMGATDAVKGGRRSRGRVASLLTDMGGGFERLGD